MMQCSWQAFCVLKMFFGKASTFLAGSTWPVRIGDRTVFPTVTSARGAGSRLGHTISAF